jgi:hypothetical protein
VQILYRVDTGCRFELGDGVTPPPSYHPQRGRNSRFKTPKNVCLFRPPCRMNEDVSYVGRALAHSLPPNHLLVAAAGAAARDTPQQLCALGPNASISRVVSSTIPPPQAAARVPPRAPAHWSKPRGARMLRSARPKCAQTFAFICPLLVLLPDIFFGCGCAVCPSILWPRKRPRANTLFVSLFLIIAVVNTHRTSYGSSTKQLGEQIPILAALKAVNLRFFSELL